MDGEMTKGKGFPLQFEEFVDLSQYLIMDSMNTHSSLPEVTNPVKDTKPSNSDVIVSHEDIPEDVWALLNEMEVSMEAKTKKQQVTKNSNPCFTEQCETLLGLEQEILHELMETSLPSNDLQLKDTEVNTPQFTSEAFQSPFSFQSKTKGSSVDLPIPFEFPLDVNTPDVDLGMFTSNIDFTATPVIDNIEIPQFSCEQTQSRTESLESQITDNTVAELQETAPTNCVTVINDGKNDQILTLSIGNGSSQTLGKGAKLQLKRNAVNTGKTILKNTSAVTNESDVPVTTIIVHLINPTSAAETNNVVYDDVSSSSNESAPPAKKMCLQEKQLELRKKNNEASRRSRLVRKNREKENLLLAEKLEKENEALRNKVESLTNLRDKVKAELISVLNKKI